MEKKFPRTFEVAPNQGMNLLGHTVSMERDDGIIVPDRRCNTAVYRSAREYHVQPHITSTMETWPASSQ